jgi:hypothetical protein
VAFEALVRRQVMALKHGRSQLPNQSLRFQDAEAERRRGSMVVRLVYEYLAMT